MADPDLGELWWRDQFEESTEGTFEVDDACAGSGATSHPVRCPDCSPAVSSAELDHTIEV